jgi:hypothetical protein
VTAHMEVVQGRQRKIYAMTERRTHSLSGRGGGVDEVMQCLVRNERVTGTQPSLGRHVGKFFVRIYRPSMH